MLACPGFSQQTVFNVPSNETIESGGWFFQHQTSLRFWKPERRWVQTDGFGYGIAQGLEIDATLFNLDVSQPSQTRGGLGFKYLLPLGSADPESAPADILIGDMGIVGDSEHRFGNWGYLMLGVNLHGSGTRVFGGAFHGTQALFGKTTLGFLCGFEQHAGKRWTVQADWLSGSHDLGYLVPGLGYRLHAHWRISVGYQVPNPGSGGFHALVVQVTRS